MHRCCYIICKRHLKRSNDDDDDDDDDDYRCCCRRHHRRHIINLLTVCSPSDHFPIFTKLSINSTPLPPPSQHTFRRLHSINVDYFLSDVLSMSSPSLLALRNLSTLCCPLTTPLFPHY